MLRTVPSKSTIFSLGLQDRAVDPGTARANYDQDWLNYQHQIGLRHHRTRKNRTDGAASSQHVPFRDLFLLVYPITFTLKLFLATREHSAEDVEKMYAACAFANRTYYPLVR